jgi:hypothetical protein
MTDVPSIRPLDTENTINTQNRIRLCAAANIFGCLLYISVNPYFVQPQASWLHLLHLFIEPLIIFVTVMDRTVFVYLALVVSVMLACLDTGVFVLNFISVNRCLGEPTAYCFERLYESGVWLLLSFWFILFDAFEVSQLYELREQLVVKDSTAEGNREMWSIDAKFGKRPHLNNWVKVYLMKIRILNLLMFLFDIAYVVSLALIEGWYVWFSTLRAIDILLYYYLGSINYETVRGVSSSIIPLNVVRVLYGISFATNVIIVYLLVQSGIVTFAEMFAIILGALYCITDAIQLLYTSRILVHIDMFRTFVTKYKGK